MKSFRSLFIRIAYTSSHDLPKLSPLVRSLLPFLSFASSLYRFSLFVREQLYGWGVFGRQRLPVPVVSVGNLTWGGNGKTPMVEFIARFFDEAGICPLILTRDMTPGKVFGGRRWKGCLFVLDFDSSVSLTSFFLLLLGYAGGDEAKMLQRHLAGTSTKIGIGANRAATAAGFFKKYGYVDAYSACFDKCDSIQTLANTCDAGKIGAVILDDGMQHRSLLRDLEIIMINGMMPWGNGQLLPRGPMREPFSALSRADIAVIHHADMVSKMQLKSIKEMVSEVKESLPIFFSRLAPLHFFEVKHQSSPLPLGVVENMIVLCVSGIGLADAFVETIRKIGALYVDRLDFNDHHLFQNKEIEMISHRLKKLEDKFGMNPVVVFTEKDYDRDSTIFTKLDHVDVLVLCSSLQIMPCTEHSVESFNKLLRGI